MTPNSNARIVAFTKDWDDVPTCTNHILRTMGKTMPVLWIESIGTRRVSLGVHKDWRRVWMRIRRAFVRPELKENQLRVLAPLLIPKAESRAGRNINRRLFQARIRRELRRMGHGPVEYWCFIPNAGDLLPREKQGATSVECREEEQEAPSAECRVPSVELGQQCEHGNNISPSCSSRLRVNPSSSSADPRGPITSNRALTPIRPRVIYYCVDDWSQFHNLDGAWLQKREEELLRRADIVFAASRFLVEKCRRVAGNRVIYMPHGVDHALFSRALSSETSEPEDLAGIPHPRIGFYGNLHPWVDFGLLESLVTAHPEWHFVLIGEIYCDVSRLRQLANVHFLGRREHKELPAYCKGFDVGIIPYDMKQARMASVNPIKTKEMLAAGVPVVAADVPELRGMGSAVCVCRTREEWDEAIRRQMKRLDRREISISVAGEDWGKKVQSIRIHVEGAYA